MHWNINDNIEFIPSEKKLVSVNNPEINVTLTTPASRCLLLLLEASPDIVLQQDFFKKVWEEEGMLVPTNTLYQNISIVRRGLRAVGETDRRLIATIPRKGFQIDSSVKLSKKVGSAVATDMVNTVINESNAQAGSRNLVKELVSVELVPVKKVIKQQIEHSGRYSLLLVPLIAFIAGALVTYFFWHFNDTPAFFDSYNLVEKENGCYFYTKDDSHDINNNYKKYKTLIKNTGLNCKIYPWVYFPTTKTSPALAALICKKKYTIASDPGCISLYFRSVNSD